MRSLEGLHDLAATLQSRIDADRLASRTAQERWLAALDAQAELRDDLRRLRHDIGAASLLDEVVRQGRQRAVEAQGSTLCTAAGERTARARADAQRATDATIEHEAESLRETCDGLLTREELQYRETERRILACDAAIADERDGGDAVAAAQQRVAQLESDVARLSVLGDSLRKRQRLRSAEAVESRKASSGAQRQLHELRDAISAERSALAIGTCGLARFLRAAVAQSVANEGWELRARVSFLCERQRANLISKRSVEVLTRRLAVLRARRAAANGAGLASLRRRSRERSPSAGPASSPDVHRGAARALRERTRATSAAAAASPAPTGGGGGRIATLKSLDRRIVQCAARLARERAMRRARFGAEP